MTVLERLIFNLPGARLTQLRWFWPRGLTKNENHFHFHERLILRFVAGSVNNFFRSKGTDRIDKENWTCDRADTSEASGRRNESYDGFCFTVNTLLAIVIVPLRALPAGFGATE